MNRRKFLKNAGLAAAAAFLPPACLGPRKEDAAPGRPNILYLMSDQHRFDCVGCSGNGVIRTPHLDRIAREGVRFSSAWSSTPTCTPARSAILTGLSPWRHGMLGYGRVAERYPFELGRALGGAGYTAVGIGKMHWFPQKTLHGFHKTLVDESGRVETKGFVSDYRKWFRETAPGLDPDATGIGWNDYRARAYALPEELHPTVWTAQSAVDFIDGYNGRKPFMLKVSFARPHSPYDPPQRFMDAYREDDMPAPHVGDWAGRFAGHEDPPRPGLWRGDLGVAQAKASRRGYYGSVSFIDEQVGRIFTALERRGFWENTLVIFFTDHGDMLGDHHHWRKSYAYEGSAHIPMLLKWPASVRARLPRGSAVSAPVELRDVLPTFLDVAGAPRPKNLDGGHLDGKSLLDLVRGNGSDWRELIDLEHSVCYHADNHWNALTDGRLKYVFHARSGAEQLFDLENDPTEAHDLAKEKKHDLAAWRDRLVGHLSERGGEFVAHGKLVSPRKNRVYSPFYPKNQG